MEEKKKTIEELKQETEQLLRENDRLQLEIMLSLLGRR